MRKVALSIAGLVLMAGGVFAQTPAFLQPSQKIKDAGPNDLRVLAINSLHVPLLDASAGAEKAAGHHIVFEFGTAGGNLKDAAMTGDYEIAILTPDVTGDLIKAGKAAPGEIQIATGRMGFALNGEGAGDVSSPDAIRKTLLGAKQVIFSPMSSGIVSISKMLGELGITDKIKHVGSGSAGAKLGPGEYEVYLYPMSEVVVAKAWKNLGPFPANWQVPVVVKAVTGVHARDAAATKALLDYLKSPAMTKILTDYAWER